MSSTAYSQRYIGEVSPSYLEDTREQFTSIEYLQKILYKNASRYKNLRTIQDDDGKIYHETWFQKVIEHTAEDQYFTVTIDEQNRLDIIALKYYNTPRYWWVIALANYIIDPFDVPIGTKLRIPPLASLYNKGGVLGG